ncbi:superoxide dismutase [Glomus cerebriforme]|uniref:Superoxide dismutase n=1 Tax=Glomus cerebriforme TaxID=658196 RepID=A0A397T4F5_9GLOM|nr:superoxide dismutase [Glomus cerebriforme]
MNSSTKSIFLVILTTLLLSTLLVSIDASIAVATFNHKLSGTVKFIFSQNEVKIVANINGLKPGFVYPYHLHEFPIKDHNCTSAGGHLDPTHANVKGKVYLCDPNQPKTCEVGDISGKYGNLVPDANGHAFKSVQDPSIKLSGDFGVEGRSVVIHLLDLNKTRIDCANIVIENSTRKRRRDHRLF